MGLDQIYASDGAVAAGRDGIPLFESGDGDLQLWVNETLFETHKYLIKRFRVLKSRLDAQSSGKALHISMPRDRCNSEDFRRTLENVYATAIDGPLEFDNPTLVSALRVATLYDYPALRTYAIKHLGKAELATIDRISIAREFKISSWEESAYLELCKRDEPVTLKEANVLGVGTFVRVAEIREREQKRRSEGMASDAYDCKCGTRSGGKPSQTFVAPESTQSGKEEQGNPATRTSNTEPERNPTFIDTKLGHNYTWDEWTNSTGKKIPLPGCECRIMDKSNSGIHTEKSCTISPCVAMALKNLQMEQVAYRKGLSNIQSALDRLALQSSNREPSKTSTTYPWVQEEVRSMLDDFEGQIP